MASGPITSWQIDGKQWETLIFWASKITADGDCSYETKRCLLLGRKVMTNLDSVLKIIDITLPTKVCLVKAMVFRVVMYGRESWTIKKAEHQRTVVLEKTLESPLDCKEIKPVNPKGNQPWIFIGRTDAEAEAPILWPHNEKNWLFIGKDPDAEQDWRREKGTTEDGLVGWYHQLDAHEFGQALGVGDRQGGLVCCSPWGRKELDTTERLNWTDFCKTSLHWHHRYYCCHLLAVKKNHSHVNNFTISYYYY